MTTNDATRANGDALSTSSRIYGTLAPIERDQTFGGLEPLICDADDMIDVLCAMICELFGTEPPSDAYIIGPDDGRRLFFLSSMALVMSRKSRDAFYVAHENHVRSLRAAAKPNENDAKIGGAA